MLKLHKVEYPRLTLWKTDIRDSERLKIINPGDFPKEFILESLDIADSDLTDSFGICDREEIKERSDLMRSLIENPGLINWLIRNRYLPYALPLKGEEFLNFFNPKTTHNPYWQKVRDFIALLEKTVETSARLKTLKETLEASLPLEESEKEMAAIITDKLEKVTVIEGLVDFEMNTSRFRPLNAQAHGHQMYSFALNANGQLYPSWTEDMLNPLNWMGIGKLVKTYVNQVNKKTQKKAYHDMVINSVSDGLIQDIERGVRERLNKQLGTGTAEFGTAAIKVYFSYSNEGLRLHIYGIEPSVSEPEESFSFTYFEGYSPERMKTINEAQTRYVSGIKKYKKLESMARLQDRIRQQVPNFFDEKFSVPSPETDKRYRWFAVSNLYASPALSGIHQAIKEHRHFLKEQISDLQKIAELAKQFIVKAEELQTSLCCPEILDEGHHLIAFDEIFPIHLLRRLKRGKIVPIQSLPVLNGQMVGLTGSHGGGKTVTELSLTDNIFLAQSGLPVFGKGFRLNVKKVLGMVFLERAEGSTCELLLEKIKNVLEGIRRVEGSEVVLVLDEIGTGTQEISGFELGRDLLNKLARSNISVLFSTQITSLAEFARDELDAECFQFDARHQITSGIGTGGMEDLRRRIGLNRLLE